MTSTITFGIGKGYRESRQKTQHEIVGLVVCRDMWDRKS